MAKSGQNNPRSSLLDISNVVAAFSEEQVVRMTGLKKSRLRYWANTDFFRPSYVEGNGRLPHSRFYSFKDIIALRTLEMLRVQNNVPLQHLRKVATKLSHLKDSLWTQTTLYVVNREVVFVNPENGKPESVVTGQYLLGIPLKQIIEDTSAAIISFSQRRTETVGRIGQDRAIARNAMVIEGTRITVGAVQRLHQDGFSIKQIIDEYPILKEVDVQAAINYEKRRIAS